MTTPHSTAPVYLQISATRRRHIANLQIRGEQVWWIQNLGHGHILRVPTTCVAFADMQAHNPYLIVGEDEEQEKAG